MTDELDARLASGDDELAAAEAAVSGAATGALHMPTSNELGLVMTEYGRRRAELTELKVWLRGADPDSEGSPDDPAVIAARIQGAAERELARQRPIVEAATALAEHWSSHITRGVDMVEQDLIAALAAAVEEREQ